MFLFLFFIFILLYYKASVSAIRPYEVYSVHRIASYSYTACYSMLNKCYVTTCS